MAVITPALISALFTGYRSDYQRAYAEAQAASFWRAVATEVPSSTKSNTYGWLKDFPRLREWVGDRVVKDMAAEGYEITNKDWESTVGIKRPDIEDDNLGVYRPMVQHMGYAAARKPDELIAALMAAGETTVCYDGQFFFDTDHPVNAEHDGSGADSSVANYDDGGASPQTPWYLLDCSAPLKPFIYQMRKAPEFVSKTDPRTSDTVFTSNTFQFGVDMRSNVGFGFWQTAFKSKKPLDTANFNAAYQAMQEFKADGGRPLGITPTHLVVPPGLRAAANETVLVERLANGASNPNYKAVEVVVVPWLA